MIDYALSYWSSSFVSAFIETADLIFVMSGDKRLSLSLETFLVLFCMNS